MEIDLGNVLDALPAMVWTAQPDGDIDFVNRHWSEYTGLSLDKAHGWAWQTVVNRDDLSQLVERWRSILASGEAGEMEARVRRVDGLYRWFLVQCNPMRDDAGRIVKWCGINTEIEERKRVQEGLRESERISRSVVDGIPGFVAILAANGAVEVVNRQILEYSGRTLEELKNWGTNGAVHKDDLQNVAEIFTKSIAAGVPYEIEQRLRRFDGSYRWFNNRGTPEHDDAGRIVRWYVLLTDVDERKRAEEALRESEREARLIVNSIPAGIEVLIPTGEIEAVNEHIVRYFGKSAEHLKRQRQGLIDFVHPEDRQKVLDTAQRSLTTGERYHAEHRFLGADEAYRWFQVRGLPLRDSNGNIVRWYALHIDINDRKRAEDALRASERNLNQIINTIPALAWSAGLDGSAEFFNQHYLDYLGLTLEQVQDSGWMSAVHPDDLDGFVAAWRSTMASGQVGEAEARIRRFDGKYRWLLSRYKPLRDEAGNIVKWYGTNIDIEDRKRAEIDLRRSEAFLAEGQRLSQTGSLSWNIPSGAITWSEQTYRIFEFDPGSPVTLDQIAARVHPEDLPLMHDMVTRAQAGQDFEYAHRLQMPDGSIKHLHLVAHATRDRDGDLEFVGAIQDVTERRLAEEALNKARSELAHVTRVSSLGALTASIAHEVNQPLSGIITNAGTCLRMLAADPPNIDGARETARRTIRDGNRAADVITRLRALFSKRATSIEAVNLNEAAREVIALSWGDLHSSRVVVRTDFAESLPLVAGNRVQLQQVIVNLLRNASDAMSSVNDRPRRLLIRTEPDDENRVRLSVEDTGVGFGSENADRLFEAFYTTKDDGMGIGLSVSRSIIENHHGRLWAAPNDGPGATFAFSIPKYSGDEARGPDTGVGSVIFNSVQSQTEIS